MPTDKPLILLIETSGAVCAVALARGEEIVSQEGIEEPNAHSTYLAPMVDKLLQNAEVRISDLDAIAVSGGPGSYTGLRIGVSLAKGLCFGANVPLIACSTLMAQGIAANENSIPVISIIDARRMDAYVAVFDKSLKALNEEHFTTLDDDFIAQLDQDAYIVVGSGAKKFTEAFPDPRFEYRESTLKAEHLLKEAIIKYNGAEWADVAYYEPNYIKSVFVTKPKKRI